jgi:hypothetical protein
MRKFVIALLGFVAVTATVTARAAVSAKDAIALYLLDEGAGTAVADKSANANNAAIKGDAKWVDGKFGKGLQLGEGINFSSATAKGVNGKTISECLWVMFTAFNTEAQFGYINATGQASTRFFYFSTWCAAGPPHNCVHLGTLDLAGKWGRGIVTPPVFDANKWYYVCGVVDNGAGKVQAYVDGAQKLSQDFPAGDTPGTPTALWVGSSPENYQVANAVFDDVGFFNVALTADDMQMLMTKGLTGALLGGATAVDPQAKLATTWASVKSR